MCRRILLWFGLFLLAQGPFLRRASPQAVDIPQIQIEVIPISTGGSLITIPNVNLPNLQMSQLSDQQLREAIPNLPALPGNTSVIELKHAAQGQEAQFLIRGTDPSIWHVAQPSIQATEPPVLWLATTLGSNYKLLTQLVPPNSGENSWGWPELGPFAINQADNIGALQDLLNGNPQLVIINNRGALFPKDWVELIKNSGRPYVIATPESPNHGLLGIESAAKLGDQSVRPDAVNILSALPKLDGWWSGYWELRRMKLSQKDVWEKLSANIKSQNLPTPINEASRDSLQNELLYGDSDFVFVIAHNDGHFVYLPGSGGTISYDEIRSLQRNDAPNRAIVLITCKGATDNASPRSLADIFLQNKLAKTVFASQQDVYADTVPVLLRDLLLGGSDVRSTLIKYGYFQFVMRLVRSNPYA